jgi:DNA repair exonuclease SbcCD nuclease subunit
MKIQYASDLHLEFPQNRKYLEMKPIEPVAPYLLLAGDIDVLRHGRVSHPKEFKYYADNWEQVFIIPGNHEYYSIGGKASDISNATQIDYQVADNIRYLNNTKIELEGVELYFTTLWSFLQNSMIEHYIADFSSSRFQKGKYTSHHHNDFFIKSIKWLDEELSKPKIKPRMVISHFVPSQATDGYPSLNDEHGRLMKGYFIAQIDKYLEKWPIDYWLYGHNHWNKEVEAFGIQFLSNQLGYTFQDEHADFDHAKMIEI